MTTIYHDIKTVIQTLFYLLTYLRLNDLSSTDFIVIKHAMEWSANIGQCQSLNLMM